MSALRVEIETARGPIYPVDGISFELHERQTLGIVGESGSGKSLTCRAILRLLPRRATVISGDVRLRGIELGTLREEQRRQLLGKRIGALFQDPLAALNPLMRVGAQIAEPIRRHLGASRHEAARCAVDLLRDVGIPEPERRASWYPHQLSGGQRQRVAGAVAIAGQPEVVIADEPTASLDATVAVQYLSMLRALQDARGFGLIIVSHDMAVIGGVADQVAVMYAGQIVEAGPTHEVLTSPTHPYTRALLVASGYGRSAKATRTRVVRGEAPKLHALPAGCRYHPRCSHAIEACKTAGGGPSLQLLPGGVISRCLRAHELSLSQTLAIGGNDPSAEDVGTADPRVHGVRDDKLICRLEHVGKTYRMTRPFGGDHAGTHALDGLSVTFLRGMTVGVVGESGSGKSTLGKIVLGLEEPTSGRVVTDTGKELGRLSRAEKRAWRRSVSAVFQDPWSSLNPRMRVKRIIADPLIIQGERDRSAMKARVSTILGQVGLHDEYAEVLPHQLSGGQRQRVAIARALITNPQLIVLDEPLSALDATVKWQIVDLLREVQEALHVGYLFISHDLSVVRDLCDQVLVLKDGSVVEEGSTSDIFECATHPYTLALLSASLPERVIGAEGK